MSGIISDNVGRASGLVKAVAAPSSDYVKLAALSATSGTTFDINGYFTSDYKYYRLMLHRAKSSTTTAEIYGRMLVSGSADSGSSYAGCFARLYTDPTPSNQEGYYGDADSTTSWKIINGDSMSSDAYELGACGWIDIHDPLSTDMYKSIHYNFGQDANSTPMQMQYGYGNYRNVNACSGIQLYVDAGTIASISVTLFGIK